MTSNLPWADPVLYAASLRHEENLVLLYSGTAAGSRSFLAWGLKEKITDINSLRNIKSEKLFGWLGYGLRHQFEQYQQSEPEFVQLDDVFFASFNNVLEFDHVEKVISGEIAHEVSAYRNSLPAECSDREEVVINSNMTDAEYQQKVQYIIDEIAAGKLYQANLTRKFWGEFADEPDSFQLFCDLAKKSPAPYSAYMKFGDVAIVSSSPEKFLTIENGIATTKPIKGTMPASRAAEELANSEKDRAENLMIVDLMRNDLAKTCINIEVPELFKITSYPAYHHMHSTVVGKLRDKPIDTIIGCFPAGSMTGAPKIAAINLCAELEGIERGLYSGVLGWVGENSCDLSVVIRTIIIKGNKFEFQAGGGITSGSEPQKELAEMYTKCKPIMDVLKG